MSKPIPTDVLERIQVWAACGRTKESFGKMTAKESEMYDSVVAFFEDAKSKGQTPMIVNDFPEFHFNKFSK